MWDPTGTFTTAVVHEPPIYVQHQIVHRFNATLSPPTMSTPPIPLETIEHSIGFLRGDIPSLAACSLTCHALLPISRVQLWHEVVLPVQSDGSHSSRTETFIGVLNRNPAIAPYVRSLVLHPRESLNSRNVPFNRTALATLGARLPALRSLRLRRLVMEYLYEVVMLIRDLPNLEALYLDHVSLAGIGLPTEWPQERVTPAVDAGDGPAPVWALRTLSLFGGAIHGGEIARLADFLERAREFLPGLNSLDFGCPMLPSGAGGAAIAPGIPSFGPSLRHFGTMFCDIEDDMSLAVEGREFSDLPAASHHRLGLTILPSPSQVNTWNASYRGYRDAAPCGRSTSSTTVVCRT